MSPRATPAPPGWIRLAGGPASSRCASRSNSTCATRVTGSPVTSPIISPRSKQIMLTSKHNKIVNGLGRTGLLWSMKWLARRPGPLVLAYHRIGDADGQPFDDELFSATPEGFRQQLLYLRSRFDVIGLDEMLDSV